MPMMRDCSFRTCSALNGTGSGGSSTGRPCVLLVRKPAAITNAYDSIVVGGDASPCELVPGRGMADPNWQFVLINPHGRPPSIALFPRGKRITQRVDPCR